MTETPVTRLQTPEDYVSARRAVFPSPTSFDWFRRRWRVALAERRAVVRPAGRTLIDPIAMDAAIVEIGAAEAAKEGRAGHSAGGPEPLE